MRGGLSTWMMAATLLMAIAVSGFASGAFAGPGAGSVDSPLVLAQAGTGFGDPQRCTTVRRCQFQRGGSYRGCISTYSCQVCRLVPAKCDIGGAPGKCHSMRCTWG